MYDFNSLLAEILRARPDITREEIMSLVEERKKTVGAGFLTDQGALYLVAGELGVPLNRAVTTVSDLSLKDLYAGANDITVLARVGAIYPVSEFKKKDGGIGHYRRLILFDGSTISKMTIWDDNSEAIKLSGISVDSAVRVLNGYVRQGLDGKPTLNLGRRGKIELIQDEKQAAKLPQISSHQKKIGEIGELQELVAVEGEVLTDSRSSNFTRQDGSGGSLTQFELGGGAQDERIRVVIWNAAANVEVKTGQKIVVTNLRAKRSMNGDREIHGDNGSTVKILAYDKSREPARTFTKVNTIKVPNQKYAIEVMALSSPIVREVQLKDGSVAQKAEIVFGDDTGEITVVGWRNFVDRMEKVGMGEKVRISDAVLRISRLGTLSLELGDESEIEQITT